MPQKNANERPLRILIALLYYSPHRTGLTIHVQRVAEELARRGHTVTVLTAKHQADLPPEEWLQGVRVVRLWPLPLRISRGLLLPAYPWVAARLLKQHDLLWVNLPMLETALLSSLAGVLRRPIVATHHGDLVLGTGLSNRLITALMFRFYQSLARRARRLIAYSEDYAAHSAYLRPFAEKVSIIHPPIQIPTPQPEKVRERRAEWAPTGGPIIGFCGRFVREKRPDLLLRSLAVINERYPEARLVFAGECVIPYEDFWQRCQPLRARHARQLRFLGLLDDMQELANFYAACDVLALTSDTECFSLVQVEAMLCGTPVVMTDTPGGRVPVLKTAMGRLAQRGDWRSIGENILAILAEPQVYQKSRAEVEGHFSLPRTISQYERLFREYASADINPRANPPNGLHERSVPPR